MAVESVVRVATWVATAGICSAEGSFEEEFLFLCV